MPRVAEHQEILRRDPSVAGEGRDHVDVAPRQRAVHEGRAVGLLGTEIERIGGAQRRPFRAAQELDVAAERKLRGMLRQVRDRGHPQRLRPLAPHREHIGILEAERTQHLDVIVIGEIASEITQHHLARRRVVAIHHVRPQSTGIVDIDIDVAARERAKDHRRAEAFLELRGGPFTLQPLGDQLGQDVLLAEVLGANDVAARRACEQRRQRRCGTDGKPNEPGGKGPAVAAGRTDLDQAEQLVGDECQRCRGGAAEQHEGPVLGLQPREDVVAQAGLADNRGERGGADGPHRRRADPGHDDRRGQRRLDQQQPLPGRHADRVRGLHHVGIDAVQSGHGVAQDRQQRIERERQHRGKKAERRKARAEQRRNERREPQEQRIEQREQREARNGLDQGRQRQQRPAQARMPDGEHSQGQAEQHAEHERGRAQQHMLREIVRQHADGFGDPLIHRRCPRRRGPHARARPGAAACP